MRYWIIAALLLLVSAAGAGHWIDSLREENKALGEANTALAGALATANKLREVDQKVASKHVKRIAILTTTQRITHAKLQAALAQQSDWARSDVPPDVARALGVQLPAQP
jgi:hypothetical protein